MIASNLITAPELREMIHYDPETGLFTWRKGRGNNRRLPGDPAGCLSRRGYIVICIKYRLYSAHRLAWLYMTGEWPTPGVDHANGNKADNRWLNLREATPNQNQANRRLQKEQGIVWKPRNNAWQAHIHINGKQKYLGLFKDRADAISAYEKAFKARLAAAFGDFAKVRD